MAARYGAEEKWQLLLDDWLVVMPAPPSNDGRGFPSSSRKSMSTR
jgi:hypothetical protein